MLKKGDGKEETTRVMKMAILLHTNSFEEFYARQLGLSYETYITSYRNEWSWNYAAGLAEYGIATTIYVLSRERGGTYGAEHGITIRFLTYPRFYGLWLKFVRFFRSSLGRYLADVINTVLFLPSLRRSLTADGVELLYIQEYWTGRFDFLSKHINLPVIAGDHGGTSRHQFTGYKRQAFAAVNKITAQTPAELAEVQRYGADAVLLTNAVDTNFYTPAPESDKPAKTVLVVARFTEPQKRISDLIKAFAHLSPEWKLQIAGSGSDEALYRTLVAQLKLEGRTEFLGFVEDKNVLLGLYQNCGVFALTSAWEGLPLVVLEAMSTGAAVVVTNIRAYEGLVEDGQNGVKVGVGDVQGIARGIETAFENRQAFGRAARTRIQTRFSQQTVFKQLSALIRQCVEDATPSRARQQGRPSLPRVP